MYFQNDVSTKPILSLLFIEQLLASGLEVEEGERHKDKKTQILLSEISGGGHLDGSVG